MAEIDVAIQAAEAGGKIIADHFGKGRFDIRFKHDRSLQTTADLDSERQIVAIIRQAFPNHGIVSEEQIVPIEGSSDYQWLIDPLDGTDNFVLGIPYFSLSIALCDGGVPVLGVVFDPITNRLYAAEKGQGASLNGNPIRVSQTVDLEGGKICFIPDCETKLQNNTLNLRDGLYKKCRRLLDTWSPALDWCLVASGKVDGVLVVGKKRIAPNAGTLILEEAKGYITDFAGNPYYPNNLGRIIGTNGNKLHTEVMQLIDEHYKM